MNPQPAPQALSDEKLIVQLATQVMGWHKCYPKGHDQDCWFWSTGGRDGIQAMRTWNPLMSWQDAMEVVRRMTDVGHWRFSLSISERWVGASGEQHETAWANFHQAYGEGFSVGIERWKKEPQPASWQHIICLAALQAVQAATSPKQP